MFSALQLMYSHIHTGNDRRFLEAYDSVHMIHPIEECHHMFLPSNCYNRYFYNPCNLLSVVNGSVVSRRVFLMQLTFIDQQLRLK